MLKILSLIIMCFLISACSASYKQLKNIKSSPSNTLNYYLLDAYKNYAEFEAKEMHDWNSTKLYSEKALMAFEGKDVYPEKISRWKIPKENVNEISKAYENLMTVYNEAKNLDPYNLAKAISSLDCWSEQQEENWQTWDINKCRDNFLNAMHKIYFKIDQNEKKDSKNNEIKKEGNKNVTVLSKNINNELMQIIYFDFDNANLSNVSINTIKKYLEKNRKKINKFIIIGHTDSSGSKEYNKKLSIKRAQAVRKILTKQGISIEKIKIFGEGENSLAVITPDGIKHPANRRVEIKKLN